MSPLNLVPTPYRILAGAVAVALTLFAVYALGRSDGADAVQAKWDKAKAVQMKSALDAEKAARAKEQSMMTRLQEAQSAATQRETKLRADAGAARIAAAGLRDDLAAVRSRLSAATAEACRSTASAALELLGTCADEYREVATAADGHASDTETLIDAWPK